MRRLGLENNSPKFLLIYVVAKQREMGGVSITSRVVWVGYTWRVGTIVGKIQETHAEVVGIINLTQAYSPDTTLRKDEERLLWLRGWDPANPGLPGYGLKGEGNSRGTLRWKEINCSEKKGRGRSLQRTACLLACLPACCCCCCCCWWCCWWCCWLLAGCRYYPIPTTGAYKRIMLGRAGAEMPACKRNQFAIRYDPGNSGLARYIHERRSFPLLGFWIQSFGLLR
ncbi:hypothetical protein M0802_002287 [Mischocyttarus mexicanus]|nr:hypothetical protein M0802_002287 [Mischocyttarus mexicanus]